MTRVDNRYLLRVWRDVEGDSALQATLRDVNDGKARSFRDLDRLLDYLKSVPAERDRPGGTQSAAQEERGETDA